MSNSRTVFLLTHKPSLFPSKLESEDGKYKFTVHTTRNSRGHKTVIYRESADGIPSASISESSTRIASVDWRYPENADILRLGDANAPPQKFEQWLRGPIPLFKSGYTFMASNARQYRWMYAARSILSGHTRVEANLYSKNDPDTLIANGCTASKGKGCPPKLILEPEAVEIMESVIISYILIQCKNLMMTHLVNGMAVDSYDVKNNLVASWSRKDTKPYLRIASPASRDDDACSTTGLISG